MSIHGQSVQLRMCGAPIFAEENHCKHHVKSFGTTLSAIGEQSIKWPEWHQIVDWTITERPRRIKLFDHAFDSVWFGCANVVMRKSTADIILKSLATFLYTKKFFIY